MNRCFDPDCHKFNAGPFELFIPNSTFVSDPLDNYNEDEMNAIETFLSMYD